jgi:hypothetical protein
MTVSPQIPSDRDLELLSAYLDGELTDREKDKLEQRLARENALRAVLDDLRETVTLVCGLPRLKAPRNFTLDPAIYARAVPWWKRLFSPQAALQLTGALGAVASLVIILLAVLLSRGASEKSLMTAEQAAPGQPSQLAMQPTATPLPSEETAIAYSGEGLLQTTLAAQSLYYATHAPTPTLQPTQPAAGFAGPAEAPAPLAMEAGAAPSSADMTQTGGYAPLEAQDALGAAAPPLPTAPPAAQPMLAAPQAAAPPAGNEFAEGQGQEGNNNESETQVGSVTNAVTEEAQAMAAATATPAPAAQAQRGTPEAASEKEAAKEEKGERSPSRWWLAGIGLVLLVFSVTLFVLGHRQRHA